MTGAFDSDAQRADDEAVKWVILLREAPDDPHLRVRFERWLAASSRHARAWADVAYAYDRAGDTRPAHASPVRAAEPRPVLPHGPLRHRPRRHDAPVPRRGPRTWIMGAAAAGLAWVAAPTLLLRIQADYRTGAAETRAVTLADGSAARLAPNSAIAITYAANRRQIRLLKGEAWFDVRRDPARPFYVDARGVSTLALGTAFDVRLDRGGVTTELARGGVRMVYGNGAPPVAERLSPGETVRIGFDGMVRRGHRPAGQIAAWRGRRIIVRDRPVAEVIDALRPWYPGVIVVQGDGFARQRVTGVYDAADPVAALVGLTQTYGGTVTTLSPWIILLSPRPGGG
jgi:transmembrane sensor